MNFIQTLRLMSRHEHLRNLLGILVKVSFEDKTTRTQEIHRSCSVPAFTFFFNQSERLLETAPQKTTSERPAVNTFQRSHMRNVDLDATLQQGCLAGRKRARVCHGGGAAALRHSEAIGGLLDIGRRG